MPVNRYKTVGVTRQEIIDALAVGTTVSVSDTIPATFQDITISDANELSNLTYLMNLRGYSFVETDPQVSAAKSILQIQSSRVTSDLATINVGVGFVDVLTVTLQSKGNSFLGIISSLAGSVNIGGQARILINGGSFSNQVLIGSALPVLNGGSVAFNAPINLPSTSNYTTYTVKLQVQAVGVLASVSILAATNPSLAGASIAVFEYI